MKVSAPNAAEVYPRRRVFKLLDAARRKPIVWVMGPAGAGKTTLVASYLQTRSVPTLWYHVDTGDADAANLFHYLSLALRCESGKKAPALPAFGPENGPGVAAFARRFFEALCLNRPAPSAIVFDDYQEVDSDLWHEVIREAVSAVPKGVSVMFTSRAGPPPALARSVAAGQVATIGWDDLRLTDDEVTGLIRRHEREFGKKVPAASQSRLASLANGWAAAVMLLLEGARGAALNGIALDVASQRLFDYFAAEILAKVEPAQREFLLATSVTPHLTEDVARRITGASDARRMLTDLARRSFLTLQLGDAEGFRYHPLLRTFLQREAEPEFGADRLRDMHRRAADALIEKGHVEAAIEQLEAAGDVEGRASLILKVAPGYVAQGRVQTLESWINGLPPQRVAADGWLLHWLAVSGLGRDPARSRERLQRAYAHFEAAHDVAGRYAAGAAAIQATMLEADDFCRADDWIERLAALDRSGATCPPPLEAIVATSMIWGLSARRPGSAECRAWAERAERVAVHSEEPAQRVMAAGILAMYHCFFGEIGKAAVIVEMLRDSARRARAPALAVISLHIGEAIFAWVRGDNAGCLAAAREGLTVAERTGIVVFNDQACALGAAAALGMDDCEAAREFLEPMARTAQRGGNFAVGNYNFYASWEALLRGDASRALESAEISYKRGLAIGFPFARALSALALSQVRGKMGKLDEAAEAFHEARQTAEAMNNGLILHACELIEADWAWEVDPERGLDCLRRGLRLARERDYCNMFWLTPAMMGRLCGHALAADVESERASTIVSRRRLVADEATAGVEAWPWRLRIRALGSFEVTCEGAAAPLRGVPQRLLQAIVAFGGLDLAETDLMDALWPDAEGDAGRRVLDTTLHRLRRHLAAHDDILLADGRVHLNPKTCWLDLWALSRAAAEGERLLRRAASPETLERHARNVLRLVRGPLFATASGDEPWLLEARERAGSRIVRMIEPLALALERAEFFAPAAALYERGSDVEPSAQSMVAGRRRCLAALGQPA